MFLFNIQLARKCYKWQFLIFEENDRFSFSTFLNLGILITYPQNLYTDLKSALDQPLLAVYQ